MAPVRTGARSPPYSYPSLTSTARRDTPRMSEFDWTAERLEEQSRFWSARVIMEAAALDVFGQLDAGPATADQLAERLGLDPRAARLFLDALAGLELLRTVDEGYANADAASRFLVPGRPEYVGHRLIAGRHFWDVWGRVDRALRTGRPQHEGYVFSDDPEMARHLLLAIHHSAEPHARTLLEEEMIEPGRYARMLDLGGGAGSYSIAFCRANPELRATLVDLAPAAALARETIAAAGLDDRIQVVEADFDRDELIGRYDLIWVSNLIHSRSEEGNRALIERLRARLEPGGELVIHDIVMNEDRTRPARGAVFSIHMLLNNGAGRCYTFEEIRDWMEAAGFEQVRRAPNRDEHELVIGTR